MAGPIFYEKNKIDLDSDLAVAITITDAVASDTGSDSVDYMRNRKNSDGWATTDSTDAANTQIDVDMIDSHDITDIFLIEHNFDSYTIQYDDGGYTDFSTPISESGNSDTTTHHSFNEVSVQKIRIIITGTMTADDDKFLAQLVITNQIGQLTTGFKISKVVRSQERKLNTSISGKGWVRRSTGAFSFEMSKNNVTNDTDLDMIEELHDYYFGFLVWLCGDDVSQFDTDRIGYRLKDLYLMNIASEYTPEWDDGFYVNGINIKMKLVETL